jgi:hypothetical protein
MDVEGHMRNAARLAAGMAAILLTVLCGQPALGQGRAAAPTATSGPYQLLDLSKLGGMLQELKMTEVNGALMDEVNKGPEEAKWPVQITTLKTQALQAVDDDAANKLFRQAMDLYAKLIKLHQDRADASKDDRREQFTVFELTQNRIALQLVWVERYAQRMRHFLNKPTDPATILSLTKEILDVHRKLSASVQTALDEWNSDEDRVTGVVYKLQDLNKALKYRASWIRFYNAMCMTGTTTKELNERNGQLDLALTDVKEYAEAPDEESGMGVKFQSLMLSGLARMEMAKYDEARKYYARVVSAPEAGLDTQLWAMFETCHSYLDAGDDAGMEAAIKDFQEKGPLLKEGAEAQDRLKVAVEIQVALLRMHYYENKAIKAKADPKLFKEYNAKALGCLIDLIDKHPELSNAIIDLIDKKMEGMDPKDIPPGLRLPRAKKAYASGKLDDAEKVLCQILELPEKFDFSGPANEVEKALDEGLLKVTDPDKAKEKSARSTTLQMLGLIYNQRKKNLEASRFLRKAADAYSDGPNAKGLALSAVQSMEGTIKEIRTKNPDAKPGDALNQEYRRDLETVLKYWPTDDQVRGYWFDLGLVLEGMSLTKEAGDAFAKVEPASKLYLPAQFHILSAQVATFVAKPPAEQVDATKRATGLMAELDKYRAKALEFKSDVPENVAAVRAWGADAEFMMAELMRDFLNQGPQAAEKVKDAPKTWAGVPNIEKRTQQFVAYTLLKAGKTEELIAYLKTFDAGGELLAPVLDEMRTMMDKIELQGAAEDVKKLEGLRKDYCAFANKVYDDAVANKIPADKMYWFDQAKAFALVYGPKEGADQAAEIFARLGKADKADARNVHGLALAYRQMDKADDAMKQYRELVEGLVEKSPEYWRMELEMLRYAADKFASDLRIIKDVDRQISILRDKDSDEVRNDPNARMGGLGMQFDALQAKVREMLKASK